MAQWTVTDSEGNESTYQADALTYYQGAYFVFDTAGLGVVASVPDTGGLTVLMTSSDDAGDATVTSALIASQAASPAQPAPAQTGTPSSS